MGRVVDPVAVVARKPAGLERRPWVKTSLAPGSKVVMEYLTATGTLPYLEKLGFNLVGDGLREAYDPKLKER